jgi:glycosyltransferase involved in cell wall biosynthesis
MYPSQTRPDWGTFVKSQVTSLRQKGVEVDLLVINGYKTKLAYVTAFFRIWWRCYSRSYHLVHAHYGLSGLVARAQLRFPVVLSFCGNDLYGAADPSGRPTFGSLFFVWLNKRLSPHVEGVIVKSEAMRRLLADVRATVIPNGVDFSLFRPLPRDECRLSLGLAKDRFYILFPYAPHRLRKNYSMVAHAVNLLNAESGDIGYELLSVSGRPAEDMPRYMNAADLLVIASFWEGSPNVVKEAMACNLRVVAADVGDVAEVIAGVAGCVLSDRTAEDLAAKIRAVLATPERTRGREAVKHLRSETIADRVIELYGSVLSRSQTLR